MRATSTFTATAGALWSRTTVFIITECQRARMRCFFCKLLTDGYLDGITGEYCVPAVYFVEDDAVENVDGTFSPKQKPKLSGQLF